MSTPEVHQRFPVVRRTLLRFISTDFFAGADLPAGAVFRAGADFCTGMSKADKRAVAARSCSC
jgi:hypothetical protein